MSKKNKPVEGNGVDGRLIESMAKACHEANRVLTHHSTEEKTINHWDEATTEERTEALNYVEDYLAGKCDTTTQKDRLYAGIIDAMATED